MIKLTEKKSWASLKVFFLSVFQQSLNNKGVSIVGTIFMMVVLGVMGIALVSLISMEQSSRMQHINRDRSFYAAQAGLEYAMWAINEGGYPVRQGLALAGTTIDTTVDAKNSNQVTVTASSGAATRSHSIDAPVLAADCVTIDGGLATLNGILDNIIQNVSIERNCLNGVRIQAMLFNWDLPAVEKVKRVRINGIDVYDNAIGVGPGVVVDINDTLIVDPANIDEIEFSSSMQNKNITMQVIFTDTSDYELAPLFFP